MSAFINLDQVSYAYPGRDGTKIPAIREVSLCIQEGEYVALAGANGSGKSTLARLLNALLLPDNGTVTIASFDTKNAKKHTEIHRRVGMVFQRPEDQMIASTIEDDVAFGPENLALAPKEIKSRVKQSLDMVGLWSIRHRRPDRISAGQMQRVALAGVLAMHPRCIIFDEASAMLDPRGRQTVRGFMQSLHREGLTIINITHHMEETLDASRLVVLDHGRVAMDSKPEEVFHSVKALQALGLDLPPAGQLAESLRAAGVPIETGLFTVDALVQSLINTHPPRLRHQAIQPSRSTGTPILNVRHLDYTYMKGTPGSHQALNDINLQVHRHKAHGLMGPTGAGKSTLLQHMNGLLRPQKGKVTVNGADLSDPETDLNAVRRAVGLVFQIPESQIFEQYVGDEIAYGPRLAGLQGDALRERVRWAMTVVGLNFEETKDRPTFALSGGEKRKVALASILALRPKILLLDEPTAGLDPLSRRDLLHRVAELSSEMSLVISSHQMEDLAYLVDAVSVMSDGNLVMDGETGAVFTQKQKLLDLGLDVPIVSQVVLLLKEHGWTLPDGLVKDTQLIAVLRSEYE